MWTALLLVGLSSLSLSGSLVASEEPRSLISKKIWHKLVKKNVLGDKGNMTAENGTTVTPPPVTVTEGTLAANLSSADVTVATDRTPVSTPVPTASGAPVSPAPTASGAPVSPAPTASGAPVSPAPTASGAPVSSALTASGAPVPPAPTSAWQAPSTAAAGLPSLSTPLGVTGGSSSPRTATQAASVTNAQTETGTVSATNASVPAGAPSPSAHTPTSATASPQAPTRPQAQGSTAQVSPGQPVPGMTLAPPDTAPKPTTTSSAATVSSTAPPSAVVPTTQGQAEGPPAGTAPAPHTSPAPAAKPSPSPPAPGTPEQVQTRATPRGSGGPQEPATDPCQLSTPGQPLLVTTEPLSPSVVNRTFLLAVLVLGVTLFVSVLVLLALQAFESYKKKDYTQVDYLINGMYADSEM